MITCHSLEIGKILLLLLSYYYHIEYIWMIIEDQDCALDLDLDLVRHLSEAPVVFVPPESIEDRLLLWMVVRS